MSKWIEYQAQLEYHSDGYLVWIDTQERAGYVREDGYDVINLDGIPRYVHRLIFEMHNGYCPDIVDHVDRDKSNNRIENLREVTKSQNAINSDSSRGFSKFRGVSPYRGKFRATITKDGKQYSVSGFDNEHDAYIEYCNMRKRLYGEIYQA